MKLPIISFSLIVVACYAGVAIAGTGNPIEGKSLFIQQCAICHGDDGHGQGGTAADLVLDWHRLAKPDEELARGIRSGMRTPGKTYGAGQCPAHALSDQEINDLLAYIRDTFGNPRPSFNFDFDNSDPNKRF